MPQTEVNGWNIFFSDAGDGPPIFLVHGFLMDRTMFEPQVKALRSDYRIVTPDLRGHGESEKKAEAHTQWDMMEDHIALCDSLGIEKAVFGGVSQGGFQSLRAALKYPDRVAGLILIDTQAGPEDPIKTPMYEAMSELVAKEGWNDEILQASTVSMFGESSTEELKQHWVERWKAQPTFAAFEQMKSVTRRDALDDRIRQIEAPAVVIHGEEDVAIEVEKAEALADGLNNLVEFVTIPGAGHSSTVEKPEAVTEVIQRFLQKVYPA